MSAVVRLRDVRFGWNGAPVLDGLDLDLAAGEVCTLVGGNGCGKSTLLQLLALLRAPDSGTIELLGSPVFPRARRLLDRPLLELRRQVTMLHQRPVLFDTEVYTNVAYGLRARGLDAAESHRRVAAALERVGLAGFGRRRARELSGGEAQRTVVARTLVTDTPVLLLDEPFSYLDADARPLLVDLVSERRRRGHTVVVATHDPAALGEAVDRTVLLEGGVATVDG
jgi:tungstate transport system ATP-binding protein